MAKKKGLDSVSILLERRLKPSTLNLALTFSEGRTVAVCERSPSSPPRDYLLFPFRASQAEMPRRFSDCGFLKRNVIIKSSIQSFASQHLTLWSLDPCIHSMSRNLSPFCICFLRNILDITWKTCSHMKYCFVTFIESNRLCRKLKTETLLKLYLTFLLRGSEGMNDPVTACLFLNTIFFSKMKP